MPRHMPIDEVPIQDIPAMPISTPSVPENEWKCKTKSLERKKDKEPQNEKIKTGK
jgi:hypothetical protein